MRDPNVLTARKACLFCGQFNQFSREHIVPESLGNDDEILIDEVCVGCNNAFSKIEGFVLRHTTIGLMRVLLGIKSKKGKSPNWNSNVPRKSSGVFDHWHSAHDQGLEFEPSGWSEVGAFQLPEKFSHSSKFETKLVLSPKVLFHLGRFLCKMGVEFICKSQEIDPRAKDFEVARNFARYGKFGGLWPLFHYSVSAAELDVARRVIDVETEEVNLFSYSLKQVGDFIIFCFEIGLEGWVVCLNNPYPPPTIRLAFPNRELKLLWYSKDQLQKG